MMLQQQGVGLPPGLLGTNSGDAAAAAAAAHQAQQQESGGGGAGGGSFSEEERGRMEEGERNSGGNRWPRQETLALLKIRSDMDNTFRDSSLKGPLWDEVSRKLAELGYHRSAKKCKEKFENVYKYHKRTKDGRTSKADGKTYRFFDQLEALDTHPPQATATTPTSAAPSHHHLQLPAPLHAQPVSTMPAVTQMPSSATVPIVSQVSTVPSMSMNNPMITVSQSHANVAPISINPTSVAMPTQPMQSNHVHHFAHPNMSGSMMSGSTSSSSTSSDSEPPERRKKRKRKWKDFFGRLMKEVIDKQEELQMKFLDTLEKRERERMIREEAWRVQEMAKMSREHDLLVQERSIAAAKDAAVISFLQKITEQQNAQNPGAPLPQLPVQIQIHESTKQPPQQPPAAPVPVVQQQHQPPPQPQQPQPHPPQIPQPQPLATVVPVPVPAPAPAQPQTPVMKNMNVAKTDNGGGGDINMLSPSPSRWPKVEVQALIKLRTTLDMKYQENGPKGPLWEEISLAMRKLGYNRNAKRCKEKWENINKYYKKVKESSKKRPEDSKTCPYFHLLDAIYREKGKTDGQFNPNPGFPIKPESQMAPIMARPEQQWPLPQDQHQSQQQTRMESSAMDIDHESQNHDDEDDEEDEEEEDDEDEGAGYEIVTNTNNNSSSNNNKASSMAAIE